MEGYIEEVVEMFTEGEVKGKAPMEKVVELSMEVVKAFGSSGSFQLPGIPEIKTLNWHFHGGLRDAVLFCFH